MCHHTGLSLGDEASRPFLGKEFPHRSQDLGMLSLGIEILPLCPQAGPLLGRGGEGDSVDGELFECYFKQPLLDQFLIMEQIIDFDSRFSGTLNLIFVIRNQDCLLYSCGSYEE